MIRGRNTGNTKRTCFGDPPGEGEAGVGSWARESAFCHMVRQDAAVFEAKANGKTAASVNDSRKRGVAFSIWNMVWCQRMNIISAGTPR